MGKYFECPNCKSLLKKSALDEAYSQAAGVFIVGGSSTEKCPACGMDIDRMAIINGRYDVKKKWWQFWK
jgi:rubrerythrin